MNETGASRPVDGGVIGVVVEARSSEGMLVGGRLGVLSGNIEGWCGSRIRR